MADGARPYKQAFQTSYLLVAGSSKMFIKFKEKGKKNREVTSRNEASLLLEHPECSDITSEIKTKLKARILK